MRHLNTISLPGNFDQLKVIESNIDVLITPDTKIDFSFSSSQFLVEGLLMHFRFERNRHCGRIDVYIRDDTLTRHRHSHDIEGAFIEVNLRKTKWLIFAT